jgi:phenylpyruvate tautomerase PptA (4-oxalocrotonate tautomerase family)
MPWIHATLSAGAGSADGLARDLADAAASAAGLAPADVITLVTVADAAAGSGAVVTIAGRRRDDSAEDAIAAAARQVVATAIGFDPDLVAVIRS